jgi:acyl-homoserine lactone acylase PvdQ
VPQQQTPVEPQTEPQPEEDYDAIRALIKEYEQRIDELEQMLPENQGQISGGENVNTQKPSEYVKI